MLMRTLVMVILVCAPIVCGAADLSPYLGGTIGQGVDIEGIDEVGADTSDTSYKLFGGVGIGENLAVEIAFHDFGTTSCCGPSYADLGFVRSGDGFSTSALALWPIHRFRLYARAGLLWWDVDGSDLTIEGRLPYSDSGVDLIVGLGSDFLVMDRLRVRLEWERFEIDREAADSVSIGAVWQF